MIWTRRLVALLAVAAVVYVLAVWAPSAATGDPAPIASTATETRTAPPAAFVDGHGVGWWARRARRNGARVRTLQHAIRGRVGFGARRLAGVSTSPDWLTRAFLCIHGFEGSWTDPAPPYFGGVQMDGGFASTYGRPFFRAWGTPDHWPPFVQVTVAMEAYFSGRGFYPWPNTARSCGLLP